VESGGLPFAEIVTIIDRDTNLPIGDLIHHCLEKKAKFGLPENAVLIHASGKEIPIQDSIAPILTDEGRLLGAVMVFQDVSHARAMAEKMAHLAQFDVLTDLPNRVLLQDRLAQAMSLSERSGKKFAMMYLDLDHFKHINDSLGHEFGDDLLRQVSKRLLEVLRHSDTASRIGGDEFVILLPEVSNPSDVGEVASKILSAVAKPYRIKSELLTVTVSIGISVFPDDGREIENLKREADIAMYQAKKESGNSYRFFSRAMDEMAVKRARLDADLRKDLGGPRFQVHYQPIVDAKRGTVVAMEALVRWNRTDGRLESPSEFIPYAEESGLIVPLGLQVLRQACRDYRELSVLYSNGVRMSVNLSAKQIMSPDFVQTVRDCLAESSIDPTCLEFEITESALLNESKLVAEGLAFIESCGIGLALDDFGTGYSSFGYLKRWKVNTLKIDQSFVRNILEDQDDREIVTSMVLIGKTLGLSVIAEGVETIEQKDLLEQVGCDELQGYYFARPRPMSELLLVPTN
jgi:diguanylate cyclase (GGDEF)-like protein